MRRIASSVSMCGGRNLRQRVPVSHRNFSANMTEQSGVPVGASKAMNLASLNHSSVRIHTMSVRAR